MITATITKEDTSIEIRSKNLDEIVQDSFSLIKRICRAVQRALGEEAADTWALALLSMCGNLCEDTDSPGETIITYEGDKE